MERKPIGLGIEKAKIEMEQNYKFRLFFTALIFATLSFAIQYPIKNSGYFLKLVETASWFMLFLSGYFSLVLCSCVHLSFIRYLTEKIKTWDDETWMWLLFYVSLFLLILVKTIDRF